MQILEKAEKFYLDNEEMIWKGVKVTESLVAAMEPEAYARIYKNAEIAAKILK